jgi:ATP-dependent Lhr-like helicase
VFERFFDESGGMQLVIHAPFGARINRAFGLALRKRFCRAFNFELQAAATEDAIVLSLGETHSFELESVARFLNSETVEDVLVQAVLDAPLFTTRWRWNASISLAVRRHMGGKRTPAPLQRMAAEDLIAVVFPQQMACAENLNGPREIPDHPLVKQTLADCLHEAMDVDGLKDVLRALESGAKRVVARDLPAPSPLAAEILTARPYAYLDDAPLEERRTQAVAARRWLDPESAADLGQLDPAAIATVREQAWPGAGQRGRVARCADVARLVTDDEGARCGWQGHLDALMESRRAARLRSGSSVFWVAAEMLPLLTAIYAPHALEPQIEAPASAQRAWQRDEALVELVRGRLQGLGPRDDRRSRPAAGSGAGRHRGRHAVARERGVRTARAFYGRCGRVAGRADDARVVRAPSAGAHPPLHDQDAASRDRAGHDRGLHAIPARVAGGDERSAPGGRRVTRRRDRPTRRLRGPRGRLGSRRARSTAQRLRPALARQPVSVGSGTLGAAHAAKSLTAAPVRTTPIALVTRRHWPLWRSLAAAPREAVELSASARAVQQHLEVQGASFFDDIVSGSRLLRSQAETALAELVAAGLVNSDSYSGLRALLIPSDRKRKLAARRRRVALFGLEDAGRWSLIRHGTTSTTDESVEQVADLLLRRYGVVFRRVLEREPDWLPPWHVLLRVYRRFEAQGRIRGGRFVSGMTGEQYALPEAVTALRAVRRRAAQGDLVSLSAADPLNLTGHRAARCAGASAGRQPRAVQGWRAGGHPCRRADGFSDLPGASRRVGRAPGAAAQTAVRLRARCGLDAQLTSRLARNAHHEQRGGCDLATDGQIHRETVCGHRRDRVVRQTVEAERGIHTQQRQTGADMAAAIQQIATRADEGHRCPGRIDDGTRQPWRQIRVRSELLGVVDVMRKACECVRERRDTN